MRQTPTLLETALQHDRRVMLFVLVAIPLASWTWIVLMARDMYGTMGGASAWMMTSDMGLAAHRCCSGRCGP